MTSPDGSWMRNSISLPGKTWATSASPKMGGGDRCDTARRERTCLTNGARPPFGIVGSALGTGLDGLLLEVGSCGWRSWHVERCPVYCHCCFLSLVVRRLRARTAERC